MGLNLLALDIGTSAVHCMVTDGEGNPVATADGPIRYFTPEGASTLTLEFHPQELLDTVAGVVKRAVEQAGITAVDVKAVSITSQRHGAVLLDKAGEELMVSPNVDLRAAFEGSALQEEMGAELYRTVGQYPALILAPSRLRWLENNRPDLYARLGCLLTIAGWLAFRLTGETACEPSLAAGAGLLNARTGARDPTLLKRTGVPQSVLPPLRRAGEVVGEVQPHQREGWGIRPGTPVTLGGADTPCGLLGMGLVGEGDTGIVTGWSCAMQTITSSPCHDNESRAWLSPFPLRGSWVSETNLGDAGNAHRWLKDLLLGQNVSFGEADDLAASAPLGSNGSFSYLGAGPMSAPEAGLKRGGIVFPTPLQYQKPIVADALRSFWESLAYGLKSNLDTLKGVTGHDGEVVYLGGGMARSKVFASILANVLHGEVRRSCIAEVSARGASAAAAVAAGLRPDLETAARAQTPAWERVEPDYADALEYQELYGQWKALYYRLQEGQSDDT